MEGEKSLWQARLQVGVDRFEPKTVVVTVERPSSIRDGKDRAAVEKYPRMTKPRPTRSATLVRIRE